MDWTAVPEGYYAIPDPLEVGAMTYWRAADGKRGRTLKPWPARVKYGPRLLRTDLPADRRTHDQFIRTWFEDVSRPWHAKIRAAILDDPELAAARFAAFATRCCRCGRQLTEPTSKTYGIGPECRQGLAADVLQRLADRTRHAHGEHARAER